MTDNDLDLRRRAGAVAAALEKEAEKEEKDASWLKAWLAWDMAAKAWLEESVRRAAQAQAGWAQSAEAATRKDVPEQRTRLARAAAAWTKATWLARATSEWVGWMAREKVGLTGLAQGETWLAWLHAAEAMAPKLEVADWERARVQSKEALKKAEAAWEKADAAREKLKAQE